VDADAVATQPWTEQEVADFFQVAPRTVRKWRQTDPYFPSPLPLPGRTVHWWPREILAWAGDEAVSA